MKRFLTLLSAGLLSFAASNADAQVTQRTNQLSLINGGSSITLMPPSGGTRQVSFPAGTVNTNFLITDPTSALTLNSGGLNIASGVNLQLNSGSGLVFQGYTQGNILFVGAGNAAAEDPDLNWNELTNALSVPMLETESVRLYDGGSGNYLTLNAPTLTVSTEVFTFPSTGGTLLTEVAGNMDLGNDTDPEVGSLTLHDNVAANGLTQTIQAAATLTGADATITLPNTGGTAADFVLTQAAVDQTIDDVASITNNSTIAINPGTGNDITTDGGITSAENVTVTTGGLHVLAGNVGIGTASPNSALANTSSNHLYNDGASFGSGIGVNGLTWATNGNGFAMTVQNTNATAAVNNHPNGLAIGVTNGTSNTVAFNISQGNTTASGGTKLFEVLGNGSVVMGAGSGTLSVNTSNIDISTAGAITGATGITTSNTVVIDGATDLTISESAVSRTNADIAINPGASNFVTTNGTFLGGLAGSTVADGSLTLTASTSTTAPSAGTVDAITMRVGDADSYVNAVVVDHDGTVNMPDVNIDGGTIDNVTLTGVTINGYLPLSAGAANPLTGDLYFEGATADANETQFAITDPTAPQTITFPDASGTVMLESSTGNVTLGDGTAPVQGSITLHDNDNTDNNAITITTPTTILTAGLDYTLPDVGADASFVMTEGAQTINGAKTINNLSSNNATITGGSISGATIVLGDDVTPTAGEIEFHDNTVTNSNTGILTTVDPLTNDRTWELPNLDGVIVVSNTASAPQFNDLWLDATTNQLALGAVDGLTGMYINASATGANRTYTIPDVLANASFVMTEGNQTINGTKTINNLAANNVSITGGSISGVTLSSSTLTATAATNQIFLGDFGGTGGTRITAPGTNDDTYTIPAVGADASFVMSEGNQTINGTKTFSDIDVTGGAIDGVAITNSTISGYLPLSAGLANSLTGPLYLGGQTLVGSNISNGILFITASSNASNTGPAISVGVGNSGLTTAIAVNHDGDVTFGEGTLTMGNDGGTPTAGAIEFHDNTASNTFTQTVQTAAALTVGSADITIPNTAGVDADFVLTEGNQTINGTKTINNLAGNNVSITGGSISGVTLSSSTLTATAATNQIFLGDFGGTGGTRITAPGTNDDTYTIPAVGADASFVMTEGNQTVNGTKTFSANVNASTSVTSPSLIGTTSANGLLTVTASTNASNTGTAMDFMVGNNGATNALSIDHDGTVTIPDLTLTGTFDGDFVLSYAATRSIFVETNGGGAGGDLDIEGGEGGAGDGGDVLIDGGDGDGGGNDDGNVILNSNAGTGYTQFGGRVVMTEFAAAAAAAIDMTNFDHSIFRITDNGATLGASMTLSNVPANVVSGQVLYIVNQDADDNLNDPGTGFNVPFGSKAMYVYLGGAWVLVL